MWTSYIYRITTWYKKKFTWDEDKNIENQIKHGISFEEVRCIFDGSEEIEFDSEHSTYEEDRFKAYGRIEPHGPIVVVFIEVIEDVIRIISAFKEWGVLWN